MTRLRMLSALAVAAAALAAPAAGGTPARHHHAGCTWGASSISATVQAGKIVVSAPTRTGCTP